jgi:exonuclease SbcD
LKIIHTADWHLGKELHQNPLETDHTLFLEWLLDCIREQDIEVLLIAGDVFDHANPSNEARKLYFTFLTRMAALGVQVVVIGGNHDSVQMLSSSSELLDLVNVHVVGGLMQEEDRIVLPLKDKQGINRAWCVALPFLRDRDLRVYKPGESQNERIDALRSGIVNTYEHYRKKCEEENNTKLPVIGMGHLYLQGANTSESEREVQLGNAAGVSVTSLSGMFDYLALGHIHRPQQFDQGKIRYSGSPVSLSFSERKDNKYVVQIDIRDSQLDVKNIEVPVFRKLIRREGSWDEIVAQFQDADFDSPLPNLYDLEITADLSKVPEIEAGIQILRDRGFVIARRKISSTDKATGLSVLTEELTDLRELEPWEVFEKKLSTFALSEEDTVAVKEVYREILNEIFEGQEL